MKSNKIHMVRINQIPIIDWNLRVNEKQWETEKEWEIMRASSCKEQHKANKRTIRIKYKNKRVFAHWKKCNKNNNNSQHILNHCACV